MFTKPADVFMRQNLCDPLSASQVSWKQATSIRRAGVFVVFSAFDCLVQVLALLSGGSPKLYAPSRAGKQ